MAKKSGYPSDVTDEAWAFVLPYLLPCLEDSPQREYDLRAVFNAVRWIAKAGSPWRWMPNDLPLWHAVYQQMRRWLDAGCFKLLVEDVRLLLREWAGRKGQPTAVCIDSRTLQSTPESGARSGWEPPHEQGPVRGDPGRGQAAQRQQGPHRGRHAWPCARADRNACR